MAARYETIRVVLLGKTGGGKSTTGNTLLGRDAFRVVRGMTSGTDRCQWADEYNESENVMLQVTDTPGLADTHRPDDEVLQEVGKSIAVASPGPHAILMVLRCDQRFTPEEFQTYETLKAMFGTKVLNYLIVVFVGLDSYRAGSWNANFQKFSQEIKQAQGNLRVVLDEAKWWTFGMDNSCSRSMRQAQADDLVRMIKRLMRGNGSDYFKNRVSDEVDEIVRPLVVERQRRNQISESEAVRQTNRNIVEGKESPGFFRKLANVAGKVLRVAAPIASGIAGVATAAASHCSLM